MTSLGELRNAYPCQLLLLKQIHDIRWLANNSTTAVFMIGQSTGCVGTFTDECPSMLMKLVFFSTQKEKDGRTIDNICGAACRMIIANIKLVPVGEVFPMVVSKLPLKVSQNADFVKPLWLFLNPGFVIQL